MSVCDRCDATDCDDLRTVLVDGKRRWCHDCREEKFSSESGYRADPQKAIDRIHHELEKVGVHLNGGDAPTGLDWNDADQRERFVKEPFRRNEGAITFDRAGAPILSGFGENGRARHAYADCGDEHPFVCIGCGSNVGIGRTCSTMICSRCAPAWCRDKATKHTAKLRTFRKEKDWYDTPDIEQQKTHHGIISPSMEWYNALARSGMTLEEAQDLTQTVVKAILDEMNVQGTLIRHSFRGLKDDGSLSEDQDDIGEWKKRCYAGRDWWGDVREELGFKPHYHVIGVADAWPTEGFSDRLQEATGWVTHRIVGEDGKSLPTDGAMATATCYAFSHADCRIGDRNQSQIWMVGSVDGQAWKQAYTATPTDQDWADAKVRAAAERVLGLRSATTDCGRTIPPVDDPDELARRVLEELYPNDDETKRRVGPHVVLSHISAGNIRVSLTSSGGVDASFHGGDQRDLLSEAAKPRARTNASGSGSFTESECGPDCDGDHEIHDLYPDDGLGVADVDLAEHDHDDHSGADAPGETECDGELVPIGEFRSRGLLDDLEWCAQAAHVDEARRADEETPDDLDPWRTDSPRGSVGGKHVAAAD